LHLALGHLGWAFSNRPWREAGYYLVVAPDLDGAIHGFSTWRLTGDTLRIDGSTQADRSYRLIAPTVRGSASEANLVRPERTADPRSSPARLEKVECPSNEYFLRMRRVIREAMRGLPAAEITIGPPQPILVPTRARADTTHTTSHRPSHRR
jgi:hypothetical protein